MQKSFWWWQCSDRYIISLSPHLNTPPLPLSPSLIWFLWTLSTIYLLTEWKSRWPSWAPVPNKPTISMDVKRHFNQLVTGSACLVLVCPSPTNLMVSLDVKHHVYLLTCSTPPPPPPPPPIKSVVFATEPKATASRNTHVTVATKTTASVPRISGVVIAIKSRASVPRISGVVIAIKSRASVPGTSGVVTATKSTASVPGTSGVVTAIKSRLHQLQPQAILMSFLPPKVHHLSLHTVPIIIVVATKNTPPTSPRYTDNDYSRYQKYVTYSSRQ